MGSLSMTEADIIALVADQMTQSSADGGYGGGILGLLTLLLVTVVGAEVKKWRDTKKNGYAREEHIHKLEEQVAELRQLIENKDKEAIERAKENRKILEDKIAEVHARADTLHTRVNEVRKDMGAQGERIAKLEAIIQERKGQ